MPKEIVNFADPDEASVSIHWSGPDETVQVGVRIPREALEKYLAGMKGSPDRFVEWYSPPLSRPDMQRLIRAGRRARDHVFGADE